MPTADIKESLDNTCVTPLRSILKRLILQLPDIMACSKPNVIVSVRINFTTSNG